MTAVDDPPVDRVGRAVARVAGIFFPGRCLACAVQALPENPVQGRCRRPVQEERRAERPGEPEERRGQRHDCAWDRHIPKT